VVAFNGASVFTYDADGLATELEYLGPLPREQAVGTRYRPVGWEPYLADALRRGAPAIIDDLGGETPLIRSMTGAGIAIPEEAVGYGRAAMAVPLVVKGAIVGFLGLVHGTPGHYAERDAALAMAVAQQVGAALANARLYAEVDRQARERSTLLEVSGTITSTLELGPLLGLILDQLKTVVEYNAAAISTAPVDGDYTVLEYRGPLPRERLVGSPGPAAWSPVFEAASRTREPVLIDDLGGETPSMLELAASGVEVPSAAAGHGRSALCVPLVAAGQTVGLLTLLHAAPGYYAGEHGALARAFANEAAVAIQNARLYEAAQDRATLEERQRLARELHDSVTQALYSLKLYAEAASRRLAAGEVETARAHLAEVRATAGEALAEMRLLLFELRPPLLAERGPGAALRERLSAVEARSGLLTEAHLDETIRLPAAAEQDLYRLALEALNNQLKHARAGRVSVRLEAVDGVVCLEVADDGVGFDLERAGAGLGLSGMRERAARLGGRLTVESAPGAGTRVRVEVPR
jgi:signal transduction histidine kinase